VSSLLGCHNPINQEESGIPTHTMWDVYAEKFNPRGSFVPVLDTPDAYGGDKAFTNFSGVLPLRLNQPLIIVAPQGNYQGIAPLELQPELNAPYPWE